MRGVPPAPVRPGGSPSVLPPPAAWRSWSNFVDASASSSNDAPCPSANRRPSSPPCWDHVELLLTGWGEPPSRASWLLPRSAGRSGGGTEGFPPDETLEGEEAGQGTHYPGRPGVDPSRRGWCFNQLRREGKTKAAIDLALDKDDLPPHIANRLAGRLSFVTESTDSAVGKKLRCSRSAPGAALMSRYSHSWRTSSPRLCPIHRQRRPLWPSSTPTPFTSPARPGTSRRGV